MKLNLKLAGIAIAVFIVIQFIPYGRSHTNPAVVAEPRWNSAQTQALARRACYDCHSNQTVWPWYSNVAPVSWLVQHDVEEARGIMNLSEWRAASAPASQGEQRSRLRDAAEISEAVLSSAMPPLQYLLLHPDADLSQAERRQLVTGLQAALNDVP
jgi:hypothetical protein